MINMPFRYTLFPKDGVGTSGQAGGGGQEGGGEQAGGGGQQLALLQLGMVQPSYTSPLTTYLRCITIQLLNYLMRIVMQVTQFNNPGSSLGDSSFALTPDLPLYGEDDPFASPAPLSIPTSWDQITEVLESPEGYI
jgi:hypothetical protein